MGNALYLYHTTGPSSLVARVHAAHVPHVGQDVSLIFDISKAHFFHKDTEATLL